MAVASALLLVCSACGGVDTLTPAVTNASAGHGGAGGAGGGIPGEAGSAGSPSGGGPSAPPRALIVGTDFGGYMDDLRARLAGTGDFETVDVLPLPSFGACESDGGAQTPSLETLLGYDVALVTMFGAFPQGHFALGDVLAEFFDAGGRVVHANTYSGWLVGGRFYGYNCSAIMQNNVCSIQCEPLAEHYTLLHEGDMWSDGIPDALVAVRESALLDGVASLSSPQNLHLHNVVVEPHVTVVARWQTDSAPMAVTGKIAGRTRADLNLVPASADLMPSAGWTGDGTRLMRNALLMSE